MQPQDDASPETSVESSTSSKESSQISILNFNEMSEEELRRQVMISVIRRNNAETSKLQTETQLAESRMAAQNARDHAIGNFFTSISGLGFFNPFRR